MTEYVMHGTPEEHEDIARTVLCPRCGAEPYQPCRYDGRPGGKYDGSHVGRLKVAVPRPRTPYWWWLDMHDDLLLNAWLREHGEVLLAVKR